MSEEGPAVDEIGYWSEVKLDIIREYAAAYSRILAARENPALYHIYVDAFAGPGYHLSRTTGAFVLGSPLNALNLRPPFREYHFIELDARKAAALRELTSEPRKALLREGICRDVVVHQGDCNEVLPRQILPRCRRTDYRRALWLLDPNGLHYRWAIVAAAGRAGSVDLFLNFPTMDMNRNVLWEDHSRVSPSERTRMDNFWGDESWREAAYSTTRDLFGYEHKTDNPTVAKAYCQRLRAAAGFGYVAEPLPMRNPRGAVVYYLLFAAHKPVAVKIVRDIFRKYLRRAAGRA